MGTMASVNMRRRIGASAGRVVSSMPDGSAVAEWAREYAHVHAVRLAEDLEMVARFAAPEAQILECGGAPFFLTLALHESGYRIRSVDIEPERFAGPIATSGLEVHKLNFETERLPFPDNTFDLVLFNEVFEHLRLDLIATMTEVCRVLKVGGLLLLSTPNHRSLRALYHLLWRHSGTHCAAELYRQYAMLRDLGHMGHVREYTAREVSEFLDAIGLRTREIVFRYHTPGPPHSHLLRICLWVERLVGTALPSLRPLFSVVCEKEQVRGPPESKAPGDQVPRPAPCAVC